MQQYESYKKRMERFVEAALVELGQGCCKIQTNYESPDRDYWFRIVLTCKSHKYRTLWIQMSSDHESLLQTAKNVIVAADAEGHVTDRPFPAYNLSITFGSEIPLESIVE